MQMAWLPELTESNFVLFTVMSFGMILMNGWAAFTSTVYTFQQNNHDPLASARSNRSMHDPCIYKYSVLQYYGLCQVSNYPHWFGAGLTR